jgi:hypothetical protein
MSIKVQLTFASVKSFASGFSEQETEWVNVRIMRRQRYRE